MNKQLNNYCDEPGGLKTYENQVLMPINGKVQCIDHLHTQIVAQLNAGGVKWLKLLRSRESEGLTLYCPMDSTNHPARNTKGH